ncbi:MAG: hypothetical protein KBC73_19435 [Burkholderiaceae bacterium]|nr:hypothetical protein [Burkholderiaceae bacterium]
MVLKFLRSLVSQDKASTPSAAQTKAPETLEAGGALLAVQPHVQVDEGGFPRLDWTLVQAWVEGLEPQLQAGAWVQAEIAWLLRVRDSLDGHYRVDVSGSAILLSSLDSNVASSTLEFMTKTHRRVCTVLDGVAASPEWGHDILIVFDDDQTYYRYVSHFYGEAGEFAASGGMFINDGCSHFVTMKSDLRVVEPTIVHEMTHSCLSHLPIPAWLNEGLAVNTEQRLSPPSAPDVLTPRQMHAKHKAFWDAGKVQEFWSGKSWLRTDDGNMLSYDLARILVSEFATDWEPFREFALKADLSDAGHASASEHLGIDLGAAVCAILEREPDPSWRTAPETWADPPERGAFR